MKQSHARIIMNERTKRILMTIIGVTVGGFSVGMFNFSDFGMDPFQVFAHGIWNLTPIGYGTVYTILNLLLLILVFIFDRKKLGLGTFINIFLLGYVVQFSSWLWDYLIPEPGLATKIVFLCLGIIILCFSSSLYFTANMGVSTYDAVALYLSEKKIASFFICRISTDIICTLIGFFLGATVGIGTLVTAFFMGPLITFYNDKFSRPFLYGKEKAEEMRLEQKQALKQKKG